MKTLLKHRRKIDREIGRGRNAWEIAAKLKVSRGMVLSRLVALQRKADQNRAAILDLRADGLSVESIAARLTLPFFLVRQVVGATPDDEEGELDIGPAEIRRRCWKIQAEWSPRERAKRAGFFGRFAAWAPPECEVAEVA